MRCGDPFVRPRREMPGSTTVLTKLFKVVANPYSETPAPSARVETRPRVSLWKISVTAFPLPPTASMTVFRKIRYCTAVLDQRAL